MEVLSYSVRGLGKSVVSMIVSLIGACVFRILWIKFIVELTHNYSLIWWSYTASWAITSLIFVPILLSQLKKIKIKFTTKVENSVSA